MMTCTNTFINRTILSELKLDRFLQYDVIEPESSTNNFIL